ncbi:hypothetical protein [Vulcanisaeta thermophila]|nr:hypothetical protein [Vulcanisaeta thermophila]
MGEPLELNPWVAIIQQYPTSYERRRLLNQFINGRGIKVKA